MTWIHFQFGLVDFDKTLSGILSRNWTRAPYTVFQNSNFKELNLFFPLETVILVKIDTPLPNRLHRHTFLFIIVVFFTFGITPCWLGLNWFGSSTKELNHSTLNKSCQDFHSGIEPSPCARFLFYFPFWNWTTLFYHFSSQNSYFWPKLGVEGHAFA